MNSNETGCIGEYHTKHTHMFIQRNIICMYKMHAFPINIKPLSYLCTHLYNYYNMHTYMYILSVQMLMSVVMKTVVALKHVQTMMEASLVHVLMVISRMELIVMVWIHVHI